MKKAIERLDLLIIKQIDPHYIEKTNYSNEQLLYWVGAASEECENIRKHLSFMVRKQKGKPELERLYRHYQHSLVYLLDKLWSYKKMKSRSDIDKIYDNLSGTLLKLLDYFSEMYKDYFDLDGKVPYKAQLLKRDELKGAWAQVQQMMEQHEVPDELWKAASDPVSMLMSDGNKEVMTYNKMTFAEQLLDQLSKWAKSRHNDAEWELISLVLFMNLNSRCCRSYCINYIVGFTDNVIDLEDKLDMLEWLYRRAELIEVRPDTAFDPKQTPLNLHIMEWIATEIISVEKRLAPAAEVSAVKNEQTGVTGISAKILSGLTVDEQGAWSKAEMRAGKILNKTEKEVMEIIAMTHETQRTSNPSAGSMLRKTKGLDVRSIKKMRRMLKIMDEYMAALEKG